MARGRSQFVAAAGQYFLAYGLAVRQLNVAITSGNAPSVDVLASSSDGRFSMSFQVKTSRNAYRQRRYGNEGHEWDVGKSVIGKHSSSFWYAFVNLREQEGRWDPTIFFVPSRWVSEFVKEGFSRYMYFLGSHDPNFVIEQTFERWDLVKGYLSGEKIANDWANDWPKDKLVQWGKDL